MAIVLNDPNDDLGNKVTVLLIGIGSAALVVTIYHCIVSGWCHRQEEVGGLENIRGNRERREAGSSIENSTAQLIPAFKYQKGKVNEETCAICLNEYEEEEELRSLPECRHSYHVACIDMWLFSHSNCPVCRTDAVSPHLSWSSTTTTTNVDNQPPNLHRDLGMLQNIVIQSRTI